MTDLLSVAILYLIVLIITSIMTIIIAAII